MIILFLLLSYQFSEGQPLRDINTYLKNPAIPKVAKLYYAGKFRASDDDSTFRIIDSLKTNNDRTRPFYILLTTKMRIHLNDEALSEVLSLASEELFEENPNALIEFLYCKNPLVKKEFKESWVSGILGEIYMSHEKEEQKYLGTLKIKTFKKCKPENKKSLESFYTMLNKEMRNIH